MAKRAVSLIVSALLTVGMLSGCTIDVNKLIENSSQASISSSASSSQSDSDSEEATDTDTDSEDLESVEINTESDAEVDETDSDFGIDTSNLQSFYITGSKTVPLLKDCTAGSDVVTEISSGENVKFISDNGTGYSFVYYELTYSFGYVENIYIVDEQSEVSSGETYYVKENKTALYSNKDRTEILKYLSKNLKVTVIAKDSSGYWLVKPNKADTLGYVGSTLLSEAEITSSKATSSKTESKVESTASGNERIIGIGDVPAARYTVYGVNVESGYLALRSEQNSGDDFIIGQLHTGDEVYVVDSSDYYWYVYSPSLGMYGYVNSEFLVK